MGKDHRLVSHLEKPEVEPSSTCYSEPVAKLEVHMPINESVTVQSWIFSKLLWILWKLPCMYSADLGRLGPGFGVGVGFGFGIGLGLIGGAGFGFGLPGMQIGLGFGAGFGVGIGFGYGLGKGWAYDENGEHCNLPGIGMRQPAAPWEPLRSLNMNGTNNDDDSDNLWDQFLFTSKTTFDSFEKNCGRKKEN